MNITNHNTQEVKRITDTISRAKDPASNRSGKQQAKESDQNLLRDIAKQVIKKERQQQIDQFSNEFVDAAMHTVAAKQAERRSTKEWDH